MATSNIQFIGSPCGQHGPYTFYKAFKFITAAKETVLSLGEFFFLKILGEGGPICAGELQLLWENSQEQQNLSSLRLYFLPEHTPNGRENHHGEDEILAYSEKMILKLDDLVSHLVDGYEWKSGRPLDTEEEVKGQVEACDPQTKFFGNTENSGLQMEDVKKVRSFCNGGLKPANLQIMSFSQYCRYRCILARLGQMKDKWLKNQVICALGGITSRTPNLRIMFCRDTFDDPEIDDLEFRCDHLAPNLKGRPRKKRRSQYGDGNGDSDSNETSSDISTPSVKSGKRDWALRNGYGPEKEKISKDEQTFLLDLHSFMKRRNTPIGRIPSLGFKQLDLFQFYLYGQKIGGYDAICAKRLWKHIYDRLGGNPGSTSAATCTRRHYEKLLLPYERYKQAKKMEKHSHGKDNSNHHNEKKNGQMNIKDEMVTAQKSNLVLSQDKVRQWVNFRRQREIDRGKGARRGRQSRTVKSLLDSASIDKENKVKLEMIASGDQKDYTSTSGPGKNDCENPETKHLYQSEQNLVPNSVKSTSESSAASAKQPSSSGSIVSQSRLFRPDGVQSNVGLGAGNSQFASLGMQMPVLSGPNSLPGMFFPPFIPIGAVGHLGLPILQQLPVGMNPFMGLPSSEHSEKKNSEEKADPNNATAIQSSQSSLFTNERASVIQKAHQSQPSMKLPHLMPEDAHTSHNDRSRPRSPTFEQAPRAHSHTSAKRSYESMRHSDTFSNPEVPGMSRSLLFDFESPRKQSKLDHLNSSSPSSSYGSSPSISAGDDQPTDLSIKKKDNSGNNRPITNGVSLKKNTQAMHNFSIQNLAKSSAVTPPAYSEAHYKGMGQGHGPPVSAHKKESSLFKTSFSSATNGTPPPAHSNNSTGKSKPRVPTSNNGTNDILAFDSLAANPHPAFPQQFSRGPMSPNIPYFPPHLQFQQLYENQMRAVALEEMMKQNPKRAMYLPHVPMYTQSPKEKPPYAK